MRAELSQLILVLTNPKSINLVPSTQSTKIQSPNFGFFIYEYQILQIAKMGRIVFLYFHLFIYFAVALLERR